MEIKALLAIWSYRRELWAVFCLFLFITLALPVLSVAVLTNAGLPGISNLLIHRSSNNTIQLFDPTGKPYKTFNLTTHWPVSGVVTLEFGANDLPYQPLHTGIDIANPHHRIGDPIIPMMAGVVTHVGSLSWGYGNHIIIDHGNNITTVYAHLSHFNVSEGQQVEADQVIGLEGESGWATGHHLHFEVRAFGIPVNPRMFFTGNP